MSRPFKCRRISFIPGATYFKPAGIPLRDLEEVCLTLEEAEALRLKEIEGLEQEQGAKIMNVSRPTFQRILAAARKKTADALLNSKAIRIDGGNFEITQGKFRCRRGHEWEQPRPFSALPELCPTCRLPGVQSVAGREGRRGRRMINRHAGFEAASAAAVGQNFRSLPEEEEDKEA